jgi:4-hydroxybenzoate polyprenyltransferase
MMPDLLPDNALPDAPSRNWVDKWAPQALKPYLRLARLDRPIGWQLLLLPCLWSTAIASIQAGRLMPVSHILLFVIGAIVMRGAGSTYNDVADRHLDAQVARTRNRPLPSGQVSVRAAIAFAGVQAMIGFAVLLQFNRFTIWLGVASLIPVFAYPFMKRIIAMPQLVLGLAFAWGGLMGWAAEFGRLDWPAFALYAAAIAWTVGYDTIYAVQDLEDDEVVGIKSSARFFGANTRLAVSICFALAALLVTLALIGIKASPIGLMGGALFSAHLFWQVRRIDLSDPAGALALFRSNRNAGLLLFAFLSLDVITRDVIAEHF